MTAIKTLIDKELKEKRRHHPTVPGFAIPMPKHSEKTTNGLTKAILSWMELHGHYASRIQSQGQYQSKLGKWTRSNVRKGIGDIMAVVDGRSIMIEVKVGRDKQSPAQVKTQEEVERSGGVYLVVKTFDDFMKWYKSNNQ